MIDRRALRLILAALTLSLVLSGTVVALVLMLAPPAHGATWPSQNVLAKCSVYLPGVRDAKLRRYCHKLSKRMP